jgi:putative hemolysin
LQPSPTPPALTYADPEDPWVRRAAIRTIEALSGRRHLETLYRELYRTLDDDERFFERALELLRVRLDLDEARLAQVPRTGPVIFVANHPFGVLDGLILCDLVRRTRGDFRILVNAVLCREPRVEHHLLPVDFDESRAALRTNIETKRAALATLRAGGTVVIFPSGGVATARGGGFGPVEDLEWKTFAAKLVQQSRASVVPVFFHGTNSRAFHLVSQISMTLRLSLLMHEVRRRIGTTVRVTVGEPLPWEALAAVPDRQALTEHLRAITHGLGSEARDAAGRGRNAPVT